MWLNDSSFLRRQKGSESSLHYRRRRRGINTTTTTTIIIIRFFRYPPENGTYSVPLQVFWEGKEKRPNKCSRSQPPKPQQDFFLFFWSRRASHRHREQAKADSPPSDARPADHLAQAFSGRPRGRSRPTHACWRASEHSPVPVFSSRILMPSPSNPNKLRARAGTPRTAPGSSARAPASRGAVSKSKSSWQIRRVSAGYDGRVGLHGDLDRVRRAGVAMPTGAGVCGCQSAAGASCMHATQAASSERNKGPVIQLNWNNTLRCVHATVATFDAP